MQGPPFDFGGTSSALAQNWTENDHIDFNGLELLVFDVFKKKLDPQNGKGVWRGFTPRSSFPMTLSNPAEEGRNTSVVVLVIDS